MQDNNGEEEIPVVIETPTSIHSEQMISLLRQELSGFPRFRIYYAQTLARNHMGKILRQEIQTQALASLPPVATMN